MADVKQNGNNFELTYQNQQAGLLQFTKPQKGTMEIVHTEVKEEFSGNGLGKELVKAAVEFARKNDYKVIPSCSYAKKVIHETPEYQDVLSA